MKHESDEGFVLCQLKCASAEDEPRELKCHQDVFLEVAELLDGCVKARMGIGSGRMASSSSIIHCFPHQELSESHKLSKLKHLGYHKLNTPFH